MKNKTARITITNRTAGLILLPEEDGGGGGGGYAKVPSFCSTAIRTQDMFARKI